MATEITASAAPARIPSTNRLGAHEAERPFMMFSCKPDKAAEWESKLLTEQEVVASERPRQGWPDRRQDD